MVASWRENYDFPHYTDMIDGNSKEKQREEDEKELAQVRAWLMGGEDL